MAKLTRFWPTLAVCAALAAPAAAADLGADTVMATVNGTEITLGQMIVLRDTLPEQYQALPDDVLFKGILEQMIQQVALSQSVEGKLTKRDEIALENERRGYLSGAALRGVVTGAVTDAALQAAYDARFKDAVAQTEYHAAHILVETEDKARDLKAQIDGGADFAELAKVNSSDGSAANGGDLGWFGLGMMVKPFEDAVVGMTVGQVSGPIQTQFGWHLVKLSETRIASAPALDDMRDDLAAEIEKAAVDAHVAAVTAAATITRPGEGIDPATLKDQTLLDK
ncbi:peptidylprolyl isomerase [Paracoccaceae bacterium Fryx2]|nr:peptidylprolyl isomerase [Paracoccaceae bacterium Fryx2]